MLYNILLLISNLSTWMGVVYFCELPEVIQLIIFSEILVACCLYFMM